MEFVEALDEMMFMYARRGPDEMGFDLMRRLDRPLRHLCAQAGIPEMYDRHRMRLHKMFGPAMEIEQKPEGGTSDEKK
jgi:hypothetical protein